MTARASSSGPRSDSTAAQASAASNNPARRSTSSRRSPSSTSFVPSHNAATWVRNRAGSDMAAASSAAHAACSSASACCVPIPGPFADQRPPPERQRLLQSRRAQHTVFVRVHHGACGGGQGGQIRCHRTALRTDLDPVPQRRARRFSRTHIEVRSDLRLWCPKRRADRSAACSADRFAHDSISARMPSRKRCIARSINAADCAKQTRSQPSPADPNATPGATATPCRVTSFFARSRLSRNPSTARNA